MYTACVPFEIDNYTYMITMDVMYVFSSITDLIRLTAEVALPTTI